MRLVGAGIFGGEFLHHSGALCMAVIVDRTVAEFEVGDCAVIENFRLACLGQNQEFMRIIAANGARIRTHRDRLKAHPLIGAQVADEVAVIRMQRVLFG